MPARRYLGALQDDWTKWRTHAAPETLALVKFGIRPCTMYGRAKLFKYRIRLFGGKTETGADQIHCFTRPALTGTSVPCLEQ